MVAGKTGEGSAQPQMVADLPYGVEGAPGADHVLRAGQGQGGLLDGDWDGELGQPGRQLGGGEGPGAVRCHRHKGLCQGEDTAEHGMPVLIGQDAGEENELPAGVEALQGGGKGVHALALKVSGMPLTAVAVRMSAPPNHVSAWISRAVCKLRNNESFLSSLYEN